MCEKNAMHSFIGETAAGDICQCSADMDGTHVKKFIKDLREAKVAAGTSPSGAPDDSDARAQKRGRVCRCTIMLGVVGATLARTLATLLAVAGVISLAAFACAALEGASCALRSVDALAAASAGCAEATRRALAGEPATDERGARALFRAAFASGSPDTVSALARELLPMFPSSASLHDCARSSCPACCARLLRALPPSAACVADEDGRLPEEVASSVRMFDVLRNSRLRA